MKRTTVLLVLLLGVALVFAACSGGKSDLEGDETGSETQNPAATSDVAQPGDMVSVEYTGKFEDGTVFDTSEGRGPLQFQVGTGQMIQGFDEAVLGMKVGESKTVTLPPEKAYGEAGSPPIIPPNATLIFDITLVRLTPAG